MGVEGPLQVGVEARSFSAAKGFKAHMPPSAAQVSAIIGDGWLHPHLFQGC